MKAACVWTCLLTRADKHDVANEKLFINGITARHMKVSEECKARAQAREVTVTCVRACVVYIYSHTHTGKQPAHGMVVG